MDYPVKCKTCGSKVNVQSVMTSKGAQWGVVCKQCGKSTSPHLTSEEAIKEWNNQ